MGNSFLNGVGVALVTPFDEKNNIDFQSLKQLIIHVTKGKASYLVVHGTTGESATTSIQEKNKILNYVIENNKDNLPIVLGLGGNNTIDLTEKVKKFDLQKVDAILSICPYYNKPTQKGIYNHYKIISEKFGKPIIIYNVPSRTGVNINAETTLKLSELPNIIGIKESSGNLSQCMMISKYKPKDFKLIAGNDIDLLPILAIGGSGIISVLANAFPLHFHEIIKNFNQKNLEKAKKYAFDLLNIDSLIYTEGNPVGVKQLLELMWISKSFVRLPLFKASKHLKEKIDSELKAFSKK
ncbi:MAG: 4-hydroxy-tetrahydrodipicolinate synthase [Bacteroidetes bacterium]|nr:4-hydroxy-tetrahydrodipicolinate synthase [Bacteroidota bacterium]